jgi:hypothetical protein
MLSAVALYAANNPATDTGANPFGIAALVVGVAVLIILLITFRRR